MPMETATDVVVVGGGIAGLVAARECARKGLRVIVLESGGALGGFVASHEVGGLRLDSGAESFATRGGGPGVPGPVAQLITDLKLAGSIVVPNSRGAWVQLPDGAAPLPRLSLLGIPGAPLADDVRRIIGWRGALRAQLDRYQPLLRVRPETDLGGIVRRRMGRRVLDRLVTPVVAGVHSSSPDAVDVHAVAPGLTSAMTTQGSLSGAVLALLEERRSTASAGSAVAGLDGGMHRLVEALVADCDRFGVDFRLGARVDELRRGAEGSPPADLGEESSTWLSTIAAPDSGDPGTVSSRAVIIATSFRSGLRLLAAAGVDTGDAAAWPEPSSVELATIVLHDARLDDAPRGTGVLVAADVTTVRAKALTHSTAKWQWLAAVAGPGRHVLRLSYDRAPDSSSPTRAEAVADASALLGVELDDASVTAFALTRWDDSLAFATVGHRTRVSALLADARGREGLAVVGAWVAGTGLAATIAQARSVASEFAFALRRRGGGEERPGGAAP